MNQLLPKNTKESLMWRPTGFAPILKCKKKAVKLELIHKKIELNQQIRDAEVRMAVIAEWHSNNEMHVSTEHALLERDGKLPNSSSTPNFLDILTDILILIWTYRMDW